MDKHGRSIKSLVMKFEMNSVKQNRQIKHPLMPTLQQQRQTSPRNYITNTTNINGLTISWYHWLPSQSLGTFYSHLYHESTRLLYEIFKINIYTLSSVLLNLIAMAKPIYSSSAMNILENNLIVCIPENSTSSCTKYVNSSINGLIELNESIYPALKAFRGSYDYQMIARINPFWLKFEPPSDTSYYIMATLYMIIFVFGITGNGLVLYMFSKCKSLRTASNTLVFNLAISDFMIVVKCPVAIYNNFMRGPALGDWGCRLYGFVGGFSGCASIGLLTVISVDRYSVVVNPLGPLRMSSAPKYYYFLLWLAWFEAFFFSAIPLLQVGLSVYVPEGYLKTCSFDYLDKTLPARVFMFLFFVFAWCLPLSCICYCYFHILKAVFISKNIQSNYNKHKMEVRLAFIVLLVIGLWFLAWTPYSIVAMAGIFGMEKYLTPNRSMIPALFCKTASCLNPFLYTISHKKFRNELFRLFCKRKPIYQYSTTKSSYLTRSTKRVQNPANDTASLYGVGNKAISVCQQATPHENSPHCGKDGGIYVLELNNSKVKVHPKETHF